ncbi:Hsp20/alpha crystallin family protein [Sungkyunkwania multivorans]|uniref:Hsp20/alpha crystallin family protein n=1 Tax=Sungkyunkwania multivorans TaxID=1173618 RepID=A0ABW3CVT5_9FLAO
MTLVKRRNSDLWLPSIFDEFLTPDWFGGSTNKNVLSRSVPAVNIKEDEEGFSIELAAPGLKKEDFNISLDNDVLTISTEKETKSEEVEGQYTRREFSYSSFERSFNLPETVNTEAINASYEDGVLAIALPKREEAKPEPKRLIEIQ